MKPKVALINYEMGNLRSVSKALEKSGCEVSWVSKPFKRNQYQWMVLPGVGAFSQAAQNLKKRKLTSVVQDWIAQEKPFLGICLGYQLLFEESEETREGKMAGLQIFKGKVKHFPRQKELKVPHMGWNQIEIDKKDSLAQKIFSGLPRDPYFYFVHSYFPVPRNRDLSHTSTQYGISFTSSIWKQNLFASQFHPEKSGENGMKLLKNLVSLFS